MKTPGAGFKVQTVNMDFHYAGLSDVNVPSAYERLLLDCMLGDSTLYARGDAVESAWRFVDPILQYWAKNPDKAGQEMRDHLGDIYEAVSRLFGYNLEIPVWGITPFLRKFKDQVD